MKNNLLKLLGCAAVVSLSFSACIKDDTVELTSQGTTLLKLLEAPENKMFFAPFSETKSIDLFSLRKDAATSADLQSPAAVKLTLDTAYLSEYNDENGTSFELLPDSLYTTAVPHSGLIYDMALAAGEGAKPFTIQLNGAKWDPSRTYAMPFYISDSAGVKLSSGKDHVIALLSIINAWDGVYEVTATQTDVINPALVAVSPMEVHLITQGTTTAAVYDPEYYGDFIFPINTGTGVSGYGSFSPVFEFDPATNKIIGVTNYYGQPAGNTRAAALDPSGENIYDSDTKTIKVKFFMTQTSVVPAPPHIRVSLDWTMKYTGLR